VAAAVMWQFRKRTPGTRHFAHRDTPCAVNSLFYFTLYGG